MDNEDKEKEEEGELSLVEEVLAARARAEAAAANDAATINDEEMVVAPVVMSLPISQAVQDLDAILSAKTMNGTLKVTSTTLSTNNPTVDLDAPHADADADADGVGVGVGIEKQKQKQTHIAIGIVDDSNPNNNDNEPQQSTLELTSLRRSTVGGYSSRELPPGAYFVRGAGAAGGNDHDNDGDSNASRQHEEEKEEEEQQQEQHQLLTNQEGLAVAAPVMDSSEGYDLENARPVAVPADDGRDGGAMEREHQKTRQTRFYVVLGVAGVLALVIFLAAFFAVKKDNNDTIVAMDNTNATSQQQATLSPNPQLLRESKLKSLLPDFTLPKIPFIETSQGWAFSWVISDPNFDFYSDKRLQQRFVLATFWHATRGSNWGPDWLNMSQHECQWDYFMPSGVQYDALEIRYSKVKYIHGPCIPVVTLDNIYTTADTDFSQYTANSGMTAPVNDTDSAIAINATTSLPNDDYLYLAMAHQDLFGVIPQEITMLTSLKLLQLEGTNLQGTIPTFLAQLTDLVDLNLMLTSFIGPMPSELGLLTNLGHLGIGQNLAITGTIPTEFGQLTNIHTVRIFESNVTGPLPMELFNWRRPREIQLFGNRLTGNIPSEIGLLTAVDWLGLDRNYLTGAIPSEIGNMQSISLLYLYSNRLSGTIPTELGRFMVDLFQLYLSYNRLTGTIPTELAPPNATLWRLRLEENFLTGTLPSEIGRLTNALFPSPGYGQGAHSLHFFRNMLTGTLPTEIAAITSMQSFKGLDNQISGTIPSEFFSHSMMLYFWMQNNLLSGSIASGIGNWTNIKELTLDNNLLNGTLPSQIGSLQTLEVLSIGGNDLTGTIPSEYGTLVTNGTLNTFNASSSYGLYGTLPVEFCEWSKTELSILVFDCATLCGCDCSCNMTNHE